ncbi:uncharacterized protein LOC142583454 isoform X3 [Dermacentor variabilis]|uniref:uncharacterized protein LOC142583454 isoform X3 n=1 Tax=Dermacentor variabilis TaxID=34621 RepID=UPI003F5B148A
MSHGALAWLFLVGAALGSPSCHISSRNTTASVTCAEFGSAVDFEHFIQRPLSRPTLSFVLRDSRLERLPAGAFTDVSATSLELNNVTVETFEFAEEDNPFAGLRCSVENVTFSGHSSLPPSWAILADMQSLRALAVVDAAGPLNLTRDFGLLPSGMRHVTIDSAQVGYLDDLWVAALTNLESLALRNTDVSELKRSIMARPAAMLRNLDLSHPLYITQEGSCKDTRMSKSQPSATSRSEQERTPKNQNTLPCNLDKKTRMWVYWVYHLTKCQQNQNTLCHTKMKTLT